MRRALPVLTVLSFVLGLSALHSAEESMKYPETRKGDVADTLHGKKVADPYRWLETDARTSKEVADWVEAENKVTFAYLKKIPSRKPIQKRLTELWNYERQAHRPRPAGTTSSCGTTASRTNPSSTSATSSAARSASSSTPTSSPRTAPSP